MTNWHVIPLNDLKPHVEAGTFYPCDPQLKVEGPDDQLVIHNAWDGREFFEQSARATGH